MRSVYLLWLWMIIGVVTMMSSACRKQSKSGKVDEVETEEVTTEKDTGNDSGNDAVVDEELMYYGIDYYIDVGQGTFGPQYIFETYSISTCKNERLNVKNEVSPYIRISIYYHEGYPLVGTHMPDDQTLDVQDAADPEYQQGFEAGYSPDNYSDEEITDDHYIWAESGTVTISEEGDKYKLTYDIVFNDEIHETGEWLLTPCGSPNVKNP